MLHILKKHIDKKWSLASLLTLVGGGLLACMCVVVVASVLDDDLGTRKVVVNGQLTKSGAMVQNYDIDFPIFRMEAVDMDVRNYATHQAEAFFDELGDKKDDLRSHLSVTYAITHFGTATTTVVFHKQERLLDQAPKTSQALITFDLASQKQLAITDIFKDKKASEKLLSRILHDYFQHNKTGKLTDKQLNAVTHFSLKNVHEFTLSEDAIVLYMDPDNLGSTKNLQSVAIRKSLLKSVLNKPYISTDPDKIATEPAKPDYSINSMPQHDTVINPRGKMLALTFDDGPGSLTPRVLDALKQSGAHATFFLIGQQVAGYSGTVRREVAEGNEVGNHSWNHADLTALPGIAIQQQVQDTQNAIRRATGGYSPVRMRPPYGAVNSAVTSYLKSQKLGMELWTVDTQDWLDRDAQIVYSRIMAQAGDGQVILVHDIHPTSVEAAVRAIPALVAKGYQLVTVTQLQKYR